MFSALLLAISTAALAQFALYYMRAVVAGVAAQPISAEVLTAARVEDGVLRGRDFRTFEQLHELTPNLQKSSTGLSMIKAYYRLIHTVGTLATGRASFLANWAERERVLCARYAAVQIDRRLQSNLALAAAIRSC
jgi:hypothetical protein